MKFYVAGKWGDRKDLAVFANLISGLGHHCTAHWLQSGTEDEEAIHRWADYAERDMYDIYDAEVFILFTETTPPQRNSRLVELGLALAYGKEVIIIGPTETIFCTLADEQFDTKEQYLEYLMDEHNDSQEV